jgi:DNA-binding transcriptional MerR regulator
MEEKQTLLTITDTAKLLGICPQTLRNWEKRENFPFRIYHTLGGHRRYSLEEIKEFLAQNYKGGDIVE